MPQTQVISPPLPGELPASVLWLLAALTGRELPPLPETDDPWDTIVTQAVQQRLAPLLWFRLRGRSAAAAVPDDVMVRLRAVYLANAVQGMKHLQELGRVLTALQAANVPAIALKGACLAQEVYGNVALRLMGDMDLLVPRSSLVQSVEVMATLAYHAGYRHESEADQAFRQHLPRFVTDDGKVVELHWTIADPVLRMRFGDRELVGIWERARGIRLGNAPALMLAPEDMLLHLCLHSAGQHLFFFNGLRNLFDVSMLIDRFGAELDWRLVAERADEWGMRRSAWLMLLLAARMAGAKVPESVLAQLDEGELPAAVVTQAVANMADVSDPAVTSPVWVEFARRSSWRRSLWALRQSLLLSPAEMAWLYPAHAGSWRLYLDYPVRWAVLVRRYGGSMWALLAGDQRMADDVHNQDALTLWLRQ